MKSRAQAIFLYASTRRVNRLFRSDFDPVQTGARRSSPHPRSPSHTVLREESNEQKHEQHTITQISHLSHLQLHTSV